LSSGLAVGSGADADSFGRIHSKATIHSIFEVNVRDGLSFRPGDPASALGGHPFSDEWFRSEVGRRDRVWDRIAWCWLAGALALALLTFRHYGVPFDEQVQDVYGRAILSWFVTGGTDRTAVEYLDLFYYGGLFDTLAALVNLISPFGHWETRHLLVALTGLIGLAGTWRLGRQLGGPVCGLLALVFLSLWPSWWGMIFLNPKDIPFGAATIWALVGLTRIGASAGHPGGRVILLSGIAIGAGLATRIGGLLLVGYLGLVLAQRAILPLRPGLMARALRDAMTVLAPVLGIAFAMMVLFWPFAQLDPVGNPWLALKHFAALRPNIETLYFGVEVGSDRRPLLYLPVYLLLKAPEPVLLVLAAGVLGFARSAKLRSGLPQARSLLPLVLSLVVPIIYVLTSRPELYDAERHFLFLLPSVSVLAALLARAIWHALKGGLKREILVIVMGSSAVLPVAGMVALHPYQYAYYNLIIGGLRGAEGRFETEYWGSALTEAARLFAEQVLPHHAGPLTLSVCGDSAGPRAVLPARVTLVDEYDAGDYFLATTRHRCDLERNGRTLISVGRFGVPFAVIKDGHPVVGEAAISGEP
jgi:hypothetical protein